MHLRFSVSEKLKDGKCRPIGMGDIEKVSDLEFKIKENVFDFSDIDLLLPNLVFTVWDKDREQECTSIKPKDPIEFKVSCNKSTVGYIHIVPIKK